MEHTTIAVDLAKSVFQVAVSHRTGRKSTRSAACRATNFSKFFWTAARRLPCCSRRAARSHHWSRQLQQLGHNVRQLPAHDVRRYVRRNKTDRTDAKGLLEANRNEGDSCRPGEDRGSASRGVAASPPISVARHADIANQHPPRLAPRIRPHDSGRRAPRRSAGP